MNIVQFPSNHKNERDYPLLHLCNSVTELIEKAISLQLIVSCTVISSDNLYKDEKDDNNIYLLVVRFPDGCKAYFEMMGFQLKKFLNGMCVAYAIMHPKTPDDPRSGELINVTEDAAEDDNNTVDLD